MRCGMDERTVEVSVRCGKGESVVKDECGVGRISVRCGKDKCEVWDGRVCGVGRAR